MRMRCVPPHRRRSIPAPSHSTSREGEVRILRNKIAHIGRLAPGPDYKLYLTPEFVTDEASFLAVKSRSRRVGDIRSFDGFIVDVPPEVNASEYTTVVVWCEAFSQFITAAKYR